MSKVDKIEEAKILSGLLLSGKWIQPPTEYCRVCGRSATKKFELERWYFIGLPYYVIKVICRCPKFLHSLFRIATYTSVYPNSPKEDEMSQWSRR